jgi:hypothetical protein
VLLVVAAAVMAVVSRRETQCGGPTHSIATEAKPQPATVELTGNDAPKVKPPSQRLSAGQRGIRLDNGDEGRGGACRLSVDTRARRVSGPASAMG